LIEGMRAPLLGSVVGFVALLSWLGACGSSSSSSSETSDSGTPAADANAPVDGSTGVDASDGAVAVDSSVPCTDCVTGTLRWADTGGLTIIHDESSLGACRNFQRKRTFSTDGGTSQCNAEIGACSAAPVAVGDIERALAEPDVLAAFAAAPAGVPPVYGVDSRPVDGTVFEIARDGKVIDVGSPCGGSSSSCVPIPPGVAALVTVLHSLDTQELAKPGCAALH
jgi:hypothetical protein